MDVKRIDQRPPRPYVFPSPCECVQGENRGICTRLPPSFESFFKFFRKKSGFWVVLKFNRNIWKQKKFIAIVYRLLDLWKIREDSWLLSDLPLESFLKFFQKKGCLWTLLKFNRSKHLKVEVYKLLFILLLDSLKIREDSSLLSSMKFKNTRNTIGIYTEKDSKYNALQFLERNAGQF